MSWNFNLYYCEVTFLVRYVDEEGGIYSDWKRQANQ